MQINVAIVVMSPDGSMTMVQASAGEAIPYFEDGTAAAQFDQAEMVIDRLIADCHERAKEQVASWRLGAERSQ